MFTEREKARTGREIFLSLPGWEPEKHFVTVAEDDSHSLTDIIVLSH